MIKGISKESNLYYYEWIDIIRTWAIFGVICIHVVDPLIKEYDHIQYWMIGNITFSFVNACVPLFFMISGFLLLQKQEPVKIFFKKRVSRIALPWLCWSIIYFLWRVFYKYEDIGFPSMINGLFINNVYPHMWFLYALMGLYLFIPILRVYIQKATDKNILYYISLWFISTSLMPLFSKLILLLWNKNTRLGIDLKMLGGFSGYLLLGYIIGKSQTSKKWIHINYFIYLFSVLITATGTFMITKANNSFLEYFYSYLSPNVIIMSISSFIILKHWGEKIKLNNSLFCIIKNISSASFGIYLIHPIILELLNDGKFGFKISLYPVYGVPLTSIIVLSISLIVISGILKNSLLKNIV